MRWLVAYASRSGVVVTADPSTTAASKSTTSVAQAGAGPEAGRRPVGAPTRTGTRSSVPMRASSRTDTNSSSTIIATGSASSTWWARTGPRLLVLSGTTKPPRSVVAHQESRARRPLRARTTTRSPGATRSARKPARRRDAASSSATVKGAPARVRVRSGCSSSRRDRAGRSGVAAVGRFTGSGYLSPGRPLAVADGGDLTLSPSSSPRSAGRTGRGWSTAAARPRRPSGRRWWRW